MKPIELRSVLEFALYALVTNQGVVVTDRPDLLDPDFREKCTWDFDETETIAIIRKAIETLKQEAAEAHEIWKIENWEISQISSGTDTSF